MASLSYWLDRSSMYIALLTAWVAMLGSLYFSEVNGYIPCELCWYQRILMYPLTLVIAVGLLTRDRQLPKYVLPLSSIGLTIALYHYLLEKTDIFDSVAVCSMGVSCTTMWINWFGFVTIPFLSLTAFTIITVMSVIALLAGEPDDSEEGIQRSWLPVAAIVGAVAIVFGLMFTAGWDRNAQARATTNVFTEHSETGAMLPVAVNDGQQLYAEACAACHGQQREGVPNLGNALVANQYIASLTDEQLLSFLRTGRGLDSPENTTGLVMPPSGGRPDLSDEQILSIIAYLRVE
jgi:disulfide bond formation protein DsbB